MLVVRAFVVKLFSPLFLLGVAALPTPAFAANPSLTARLNGVNSEATTSQKLDIASMDVDVTVRGSIAVTVLTVHFTNPSPTPIEGQFDLDMPHGAVVTGYALDINGQIVDSHLDLTL